MRDWFQSSRHPNRHDLASGFAHGLRMLRKNPGLECSHDMGVAAMAGDAERGNLALPKSCNDVRGCPSYEQKSTARACCMSTAQLRAVMPPQRHDLCGSVARIPCPSALQLCYLTGDYGGCANLRRKRRSVGLLCGIRSG